jgi:hypothetical protein
MLIDWVLAIGILIAVLFVEDMLRDPFPWKKHDNATTAYIEGEISLSEYEQRLESIDLEALERC